MAAKTTESNYSCDVCGLQGLSEESLRVHMANSHKQSPSFYLLSDSGHISSNVINAIICKSTPKLDHITLENETLNFIDDEEDEDDEEGLENFKTKHSETSNSNLFRNERSIQANNNCNNNNNNYNSDSNSNTRCTSAKLPKTSKSKAFEVPDSPLRKQINFTSKKDPVSPTFNRVQHPQKCMLCRYLADSANELQEHINKEHFDLTSPSTTHFLHSTKNSDEWQCPLCVQTFENGTELEFHVNDKHSDILSPDKRGPYASGSYTWTETCPVCYRSNFSSNQEMVVHVEDHFTNKTATATPSLASDGVLAREIEKREMDSMKEREQKEFVQLQAQYGMDNQGNFKEQSLTNMQKAVYAGEMSVSDFYQRQIGLRFAENNGVDDGSSCTKDLIPKIRAISQLTTNVIKTLMCAAVDHYASTYGDEGWGCGYRNLQMLMSSLFYHTEYNEHLFKLGRNLFRDCEGVISRSAIPSISKIQQQIELAWQHGFDVQGCDQLGGRLYNTRKWIGATEVVTVLSFFRIRCQLIDFHCPTGPEGSHPMLFNWVLQYFEKKEEFKFPLYLQHHGHSRTIIGIEKYRDGHLTLLIFDPSRSREQMMQLKNAINGHSGLKLIRKTLPGMKAHQYQLVAIRGIIQSESEYEQSKLLRSTRIP